MTKPTHTELQTEFERLQAMNFANRYDSFNSFALIAAKQQCSAMSIKNLLKDRIATWRPHHFKRWAACQRFVKKC